ncbi:hypothetical protein ACFQ1S_07125 [Kibdelosporangium lantanae]|uniref:LysR substrate-binding domain-containing protein n=1 Tax=Kibdelosporangium lantanae TaxID=1497396 RepID=A0ABW3M3X0_9PSEU
MLAVVIILAVAFVVSLPFWLPALVVGLRVRIFAMVNGAEGVDVEIGEFRSLYENPAADGRSKGAALSDLFWYWLAPGPQVRDHTQLTQLIALGRTCAVMPESVRTHLHDKYAIVPVPDAPTVTTVIAWPPHSRSKGVADLVRTATRL